MIKEITKKNSQVFISKEEENREIGKLGSCAIYGKLNLFIIPNLINCISLENEEEIPKMPLYSRQRKKKKKEKKNVARGKQTSSAYFI